MIGSIPASPQSLTHWARLQATALLSTVLLILAGCGGTQVYTADKTIVYNGALYNMGTVQRVSSRVEGQLPDGSLVDMRTLDRKGIETLLEESAPVMVSAIVEMDGKEMVYQRSRVEKYSEYNKLAGRFDDAMEDINDFMGDKKKTQLKLK
jgi:hypothetical protein